MPFWPSLILCDLLTPVLSMPDCGLLEQPHPRPSCHALPNSSSRASGVGAAEDLNRCGLMSQLLVSLILGLHCTSAAAAGGSETAATKYSAQGQRQWLLSALLIIYSTAPSKPDSLGLGHQSQLICLQRKNQLRLHCLPQYHHVCLLCLNHFPSNRIPYRKTCIQLCLIGEIWAAILLRLTSSVTRSMWCCSSYL